MRSCRVSRDILLTSCDIRVLIGMSLRNGDNWRCFVRGGGHIFFLPGPENFLGGPRKFRNSALNWGTNAAFHLLSGDHLNIHRCSVCALTGHDINHK